MRDETSACTLRRLREVLAYKPRKGVFVWKVKRKCHGGYVVPGSVAGTRNKDRVQIIYAGVSYRAHRLAWLYMTGEWPRQGYEIDHINGDNSDNRWCNLRLVTRQQNTWNTHGLRPCNKSGQRGVSWVAKRAKWEARITVDYKVTLLGQFTIVCDAIDARRKAEIRYYGQYAPC
jgi:hypothetical protein